MLHANESEDAEALARRKWKLFKVSTNGDFVPLKWNWAETRCSVPEIFVDNFENLYKLDVKDDDVFISTFPKSGTTWIQEATWLLLNNLDYERAKREHLWRRSVYMDVSLMYEAFPSNSIESVKQVKSPRCIKSHLPAHLLPRQIWQKKVKVVYCARNPKDVILSYGHFLLGRGAYDGSMEEFIDDFLNAETPYTPYWPHVLTMWLMRSETYIFFTTYEEMKRDLRGVLKRLVTFLGKPDLSEAQMDNLLNHLSFENMKANPQTNPTTLIKAVKMDPNLQEDFEFMRSGKVGSYKDELSEENQQRINEWSEQFLNKHNVTLSDIFGELS